MPSSRSPQQEDKSLPSQSESKISQLPKIAFKLFLATVLLVIGVVIGVAYNKHQIKRTNDQQSNEKNKTAIEDNSKTGNEQQKKDTKPVLTVEIVNPQEARVPIKLSTDGTLVAKDTVNVSAKVAGIAVEQILVEEGDSVKKGQLLATFDNTGIQQNVIQAEAQVAQAKASLENAKAVVSRVMPLLKIDAVSRQEVDSYVTQARQAKANLLALQASANTQKLRLKDSQVVAPVAGIISKKNISIGQVPQGSLFTLIEDGILEWQSKINPKDVNKLKIGMPVLLKTPDKQNLSGELTRIEPMAGNDRQVNVRVAIQASDKFPIKPNMLLTGEFLLDSKDQLIVPASTLVGNDGYSYLVTVTDIQQNNDKQAVGIIKRVKVETGEHFNDLVVITSDIPDDLPIVRQGGSFLNDGDKVRLYSPAVLSKKG